mmetsp:Transcript_55122/g.165125  ORF Transcript_55122/g.165125 Transcript_55122/m.165125 type:complete len:230 (-) Transcript_55122:1398-2087(-)
MAGNGGMTTRRRTRNGGAIRGTPVPRSSYSSLPAERASISSDACSPSSGTNPDRPPPRPLLLRRRRPPAWRIGIDSCPITRSMPAVEPSRTNSNPGERAYWTPRGTNGRSCSATTRTTTTSSRWECRFRSEGRHGGGGGGWTIRMPGVRFRSSCIRSFIGATSYSPLLWGSRWHCPRMTEATKTTTKEEVRGGEATIETFSPPSKYPSSSVRTCCSCRIGITSFRYWTN